MWLCHLVAAFAFVARFGPDVPLWDDYAVIPQLCGERPVTLEWLWSQHSEHRIPLGRLILLASFRAAGGSPRPVMFLMAGLLGLLAALLIVAARRARGGSSYHDAMLPIVLLILGHHANLLWAIQIVYVLPVFLLGAMLALVAGSRTAPHLASMVVAAVYLTMLPLCNAGGLAFVPAMAAWFWATAAGLIVVDGRAARPRAAILALLPIPALVLTALYFRGYAAPPHHAAPGGPAAAARTTAQFLGMGLGDPGASLWPWSGILVVAMLAGSVATLALAWLKQLGERARVEGLLCVLGAVASLAIGSGWGRSGEDVSAGLQSRYTTLAVPAILASYVAFSVYGSRVTRRLIPAIMGTIAAILIWPNVQEGLKAGRRAGEQSAAFDRDLAAGTPTFRLVRRYSPFLHPSQEDLRTSLESLKRAGIGKFRMLRPDPPLSEQPVALTPADVRLARWDGRTIEATGPDPWVRFDLPAPVPACGVRIRYDHQNAAGAPARFRLAWRRPGQDDFPDDQQYGNWNLPSGRDLEVTVWIDDVVSQLRLQPDNRPCRFTIREMTLLTPPSNRGEAP
ncbi:hypothetical protein OJF2_27080 [Aquisphaera giovannonii]|uniref:Glycosyltransferase RgtA/B/C/D-like domain-containing protein n=1 Tax=Aquisphaera giovannonii TaxID=406548 RepID=A0A5B9W0V6_9BACT|nr:hypothetical protein [Aquisphaera giovannonii]QEH34173.1 hypothetical protein OJF2_27080 [Aquisphaera giovannonii]